ncbi:major facilitator superfamily domain-containing protein [Lasiosphaeris hirsuta]|uniref:Major facilitator superfamily domain-containing protein n=1 Tax=Lasiosphaeris hirsuta TaxID=260670 RepID=A0AA40B9Q7_9PEZI|nr:major facilitator superfamily domain-containing protein [Lasiosphaeris hirsuta]
MTRNDCQGPSNGEAPSTAPEETPLLAPHPNLGPSSDPVELERRRELLRPRVLILCMVIVFLLELGSGMAVAPTISIMERIICRQMQGHGTGLFDDCDLKANPVQDYLAMLLGWQLTFESIPGLLCAVPYGILSDRWGRRPVFLLGVIGECLNTIYTCLILAFPDIFPLWTVWFAWVFTLIGGGGQLIVAMLYTFVSDVTPVADRATAFFRIMTVFLISQMVAAPLAGLLMIRSDWIPLTLSLGATALCTPAGLALPETLHLHASRGRGRRREGTSVTQTGDGSDADDEEEDDDTRLSKLSSTRRLWHKAREGLAEMWAFVVGNKSISFLMLSLIFVVLGKLVQDMLLQYATKRYGWSYSKASFLFTARSVASLVTLILVLPGASWFCFNRLAMSGVAKDISLARLSGLVQIVGCLLIAVAANGYVLAAGLIWLSLGSGMSSLVRSLMNALVEEHHVGTVNTMVSFMETAGAMIAGPLLAKSWSIGMHLGGFWIGLPFFTAGLFFTTATAILFMFRLPAGRRSSTRVT